MRALPTLAGLATACALGALTVAAAPESLSFSQLLSEAPHEVRSLAPSGGSDSAELWLTQPSNPGAALPAVLWIHGGAWKGGEPATFLPLARYFDRRGAVGFVLRYQLLSPDRGTVWDCLADCTAALRHLKTHAEELGIDPLRIAVGGDSAGGHLAAALGTLLPPGERPAALLLYNPVLDLTEGDWRRFVLGGPSVASAAIPVPGDDASTAAARAASPIFFVDRELPPTLLAHGTADAIVPIEQARRFAEAAQRAGARVALREFPGARHAFVIPRYKTPEPTTVEALRAADQFLTELGWLTGEPLITPSIPPAW